MEMMRVAKGRVEELVELSKHFQKLTFEQKLKLMDEDIRILKKAHGGKSPKDILQRVEKIRRGNP